MKIRQISRPLSFLLNGMVFSVFAFAAVLSCQRLPYLLEGTPAGLFAFLTGFVPVSAPSADSDPSVYEIPDEEEFFVLLPDEGAIPGITIREQDIEKTPVNESEPPLPDNAEPVKVLTISSSLKPKNNPGLSFDEDKLWSRTHAFDRGKDAVLIVHTHGSESYSLSSRAFVAENRDARSLDTQKNVVAVGDVLEKELTERGFRVIHNRTLCDEPGFRTAYKTALGVIEQEMKKDPSIAMVLDLHRDSLEASDGTRYKLISGDGKSSQIMFVVGSDALLSHPDWESNLSFALHLEKKAMELYEDLARPVTISKNRYNEHVTPLSLIVECGTEANTLAEAKAAAVRLARVLDETLSP